MFTMKTYMDRYTIPTESDYLLIVVETKASNVLIALRHSLLITPCYIFSPKTWLYLCK